MSRRWWNLFDGMEELSFKPVEGGFLYRAPNPWLLGRARHYLVNEDQKAMLAVHHRSMLRRLLWLIVVMGALAAPIAGLFLPSQSALAQLGMLGVAVLIGLTIGIAVQALLLRGIKPIIAMLTPSAERVTQRDMLATQARTFSRGYVLGFAALSLVLLAISAARPIFDPAGRDLIALVGVAMFGFATIYWSALYVAKCRRRAT